MINCWVLVSSLSLLFFCWQIFFPIKKIFDLWQDWWVSVKEILQPIRVSIFTIGFNQAITTKIWLDNCDWTQEIQIQSRRTAVIEFFYTMVALLFHNFMCEDVLACALPVSCQCILTILHLIPWDTNSQKELESFWVLQLRLWWGVGGIRVPPSHGKVLIGFLFHRFLLQD